MKNNILFFSFLFTIFMNSCTSLKTSTQLSNSTWELEYVTGPKIAFNGLFPESKTQITFNIEKKEVSGTTGCNSFTTKFTLDGQTIKFDENFPITMRYCEGGGEQVFLKMLKEVNIYYINNEGKLFLNNGDIPLMRFKKIK